ncbi:MAG TPA: rhodanese-like domain-containing protein [Candidatus Enterenecus merdae]|nr:rhodanese-like domain-containing protein [Candidatus Enterenecus merdae]
MLRRLAQLLGGGQDGGGYHHISPQQAKQHMQEHPDAVILDVRERDEYARGHIPRATLLPLSIFNEAQAAQAIPGGKDTQVLVYCQSGGRSRMAAEALADMGYTQVYDFGGILRWPYEVEQGG